MQGPVPFQQIIIQSCSGYTSISRSLAEAKELLKTDPAVAQKLLDAELFEWYGSAALPVYLKQHEKIEKKSF